MKRRRELGIAEPVGLQELQRDGAIEKPIERVDDGPHSSARDFGAEGIAIRGRGEHGGRRKLILRAGRFGRLAGPRPAGRERLLKGAIPVPARGAS